MCKGMKRIEKAKSASLASSSQHSIKLGCKWEMLPKWLTFDHLGSKPAKIEQTNKQTSTSFSHWAGISSSLTDRFHPKGQLTARKLMLLSLGCAACGLGRRLFTLSPCDIFNIFSHSSIKLETPRIRNPKDMRYWLWQESISWASLSAARPCASLANHDSDSHLQKIVRPSWIPKSWWRTTSRC